MTWSETQSRPSGWPRIPSCPARALVRFSKPEGTKSAFVFVYVSARTERACRLSYEELNRFLIWDFKKNIFLNHSNKSRLRHTPKVEYIIWISERSQVQGCTVRSPPWKKKSNILLCLWGHGILWHKSWFEWCKECWDETSNTKILVLVFTVAMQQGVLKLFIQQKCYILPCGVYVIWYFCCIHQLYLCIPRERGSSWLFLQVAAATKMRWSWC